jgi:sugar phosphate isomerase/epimerase
MRCGIAIWNFDTGRPPAELGETFAQMGFDALSLHPFQLERMTDAEARDLARLAERRDLLLTVHGSVDMPADTPAKAARWFGDRLACFTIDPVMTADSRGRWYDMPRIAAALRTLRDATADLPTRFGAEDVPIDDAAWEFFADDLAELANDPRFGLLVDLGHMHLRRTGSPYFARLSPAEYVTASPAPLIEVHVSDNDGRKDLHLRPGAGSAPLADAAHALAGAGWNGIATVETAPSLHGGTAEQELPHAAETLRLWKQWTHAGKAP